MNWQELAQQIFTKALAQEIFQKLMAKAFFSWMGGPFVSFVAEKLAFFIVTEISIGIEKLANYIKVSIEDHEFKSAAMANDVAQKGGSDEEKKKAEQALIDHARSFIKLNAA